MLSTVLQKLETLFSRHVLLSAVYPVLVTVFLNLLLLHRVSPRFREWVAKQQPKASVETVMQGTAVAFAIGIGVFFLMTISVFLRQLIEGRWPQWLCRLAVPRQNARLARLETKMAELTRRRRQLLRLGETFASDLNTARAAGRTNHPGVCTYPQSIPEIDGLRVKRIEDRAIDASELVTAGNALAAVLRTNNADLVSGHFQEQDAERLDADHLDLEKLFEYAANRAAKDRIDAFARRESAFGDGLVKPTAAGNMVNAVSTYALKRYGFSMDLLWTRLQQAIQGDKFYDTLLAAKAELDSLIALFWLTGVTWIGWWVALAFTASSPGTFLVVAFAGPLASVLLYSLILVSYRSLNDLLRAAVDLYRFKVLTGLHIALPDGPTSEKRIWEAVAMHTGYGGELTLPYKHEA